MLERKMELINEQQEISKHKTSYAVLCRLCTRRGGGRGKGREFTVLFLVGVICVNSIESLYRFNAKAR